MQNLLKYYKTLFTFMHLIGILMLVRKNKPYKI
nr:MAG TPA: hypothetical protein [Caudoviricetes sp.]